MAVVGPGAQQQLATNVTSILDDASEYEFVTLLNPLSDDFAVRVGQDVAVNAPFPIGRDESGQTNQITHTERDAAQVYGLNLKNKDYIGKKHIAIDTIIPAGRTKRFKGNEAKVALRQLANELIQREGNTRLLSDPVIRAEAEKKIVRDRGSIQDLMDTQLQTPRSQMDEAIRRSNEEENNEVLPKVKDIPLERRAPGRPKKDAE